MCIRDSSEDYVLSDAVPGLINFYKSFSNFGTGKTGQRSAAREEIIPTTIMLIDNRPMVSSIGVCDTLDTNSFEFAGFKTAGQIDGIFHGAVGDSFLQLDSVVQNGQRSIHQDFNPALVFGNNSPAPVGITQPNDIAFHSNGANEGLVVEFSSVPYSVTGDDHFTATCQDDLDGNPATVDWFTDPANVPGGASSVVRIRMVWDRDFADLTSKLASITPLGF